MISVAIFASGSGSNAMNLLKEKSKLKNIQIPLVIIDKIDSPLPEKIKSERIQVQVCIIPSSGTKAEHETQILNKLREHSIDWCFLAGYMRILGPTLLQAFQKNGKSQIVNIHPSLLPAYPGKNSYERAFQDHVNEAGVTLHLVDEGVDTGPILIQQKFPRLPHDTLEDFKKRGLELEWKLYPKILHELDQKGTLL